MINISSIIIATIAIIISFASFTYALIFMYQSSKKTDTPNIEVVYNDDLII